ncbi:MAG: hypothetical protein QQW96_06650 [Tychonema bourrellyi B0820]|nr:hypothetical protein [Tychonema bourrellyi B0820]
MGKWGDRDLIVKQQSLTGFDVKLTPMGSWSVPTRAVDATGTISNLNLFEK